MTLRDALMILLGVVAGWIVAGAAIVAALGIVRSVGEEDPYA